MEIVDLRPRLERRLARPDRTAGPGSALARLAGHLADRVAARRVARRQAPPPDVLVVSVGNLRVGGTGKTPVVGALAAALGTRGISGAIITRGYGARAAGPLLVRPDDPDAADEARLLAGQTGAVGWTVIQSRRRERGLALALATEPRPRVIVLEDGHQTARLGRHLDVVILDAWEIQDGVVRPTTGPVLPFGPYRETVRGATRAGIWLLEAPADEVAAWRGPEPAVVISGFERELELTSPAGMIVPDRDPCFGLIAGLARPERFEAGCAAILPRSPALAVRCRDHSTYDLALVERILAAGARRGVTAWATTAKDWVKLEGIWPATVPLQVVGLTVRWNGRETLPDLIEERLEALGEAGP